ncbi:hypothetical protein UO65_1327 [Actinokineospora spheciospongiae]|uniref:Uncharacterized protein n=1 Tax=Actinokineospora spheciospongiae TaxID=909613 RepID=W7JB91_9PSEU|nr:hypothetical protein UO65_1327 [Actinokineospora spheciospongiae]
MRLEKPYEKTPPEKSPVRSIKFDAHRGRTERPPVGAGSTDPDRTRARLDDTPARRGFRGHHR